MNNRYNEIREKITAGFLGFWVTQYRISYLIVITLIIMGMIAVFSIPKESSPSVKLGMISIATVYPGTSPVDMDSLVTDKIYKKIKTLLILSFNTEIILLFSHSIVPYRLVSIVSLDSACNTSDSESECGELLIRDDDIDIICRVISSSCIDWLLSSIRREVNLIDSISFLDGMLELYGSAE